MSKQAFTIKNSDLEEIENLLKLGKLSPKTYKRCEFIKFVSLSAKLPKISELLGLSYQTICTWKKSYLTKGLSFLYDAPRSGRPSIITGLSKAKITALACSEAPKGHTKWSMRMLSNKVVELEICEHISHTEVSNILKKTNFSRT